MHHCLAFIKKLIEYKQCPNLINPTKIMASMFGNTYACEQLFSSMEPSKCKFRTGITNDCLQDVMLLASSNLEPELQKLSNKQQHQISHQCCAINVLCVVFCSSFTNCENQELIWIKFHKFTNFNIINIEGNKSVGGKLVRPARPCRVCFWPAAGKGCRPLV